MKLKKIAIATAMAISALSAKADITDGKFGTGQMFDVQYYWSQAETPTTPDYNCYGTNDCEVLNASGFTRVYTNSGQLTTQDYTTMQTTGQYFGFFNSTTHPGQYGLAIYNSNGTVARVLHTFGTFTAIGPSAIFYLGSNSNGTVISTTTGYSFGDSGSFTGMDVNVTAADLTSYTYATTTPLAPGQTAGSTGSGSGGGTTTSPNYVAVTQPTVVSVTPTSTNSPPGETAENAIDGNPATKYLNFDRANAGFTIRLQNAQVLQGIKFTTANDFPDRDPTKYSLYGSNDGVNWTTIVNAESITLSNSRFTQTSMYAINNTNPYFYYFITFPDIKASANYADINACGLACDSVQIGDVEFIYDTNFVFTAPTDTGTGAIANPGTAGSNSDLPTPVTGPVDVTNNAGTTATNPAGTTTLTVTNGGTYTNNGTTGNVTNTGDFTNNSITGDVTNSGTFANNGTTGTVNNSGTFNNNASGVTGNVTNSGTFTNAGTVGTIINLGTFVNSGTGTTWVSGFNGDGNTATMTNTGTLGSGTNWSTFNNNTGGTVGAVSNFGTFNNTGTTGAFSNAGVLNNNAGGIISELAYNNHWVENNGTINTVTYNGGTVINNGSIGSINNTEAHGTFHNNGTVTGTVTTNSTFNNNVGGVVTGLYTNDGTLTNAGTIGTWINNIGRTITNTGTMGNGINNGTYSNSGTVGNVTNTGTMTTSGSAGTISNSGILTVTAGTASVNNTGGLTVSGGTLNSYTQTAPGTTIMSLSQPIAVTGSATLGGGIVINNVPSGYGRHTVLTAGSVSGTYDPILGQSNYLRYTDTDVKLYVTPDAQATQASIDATSKNLANAANLQANLVSGSLGSDCAVFGKDGACVSVNIGGSKAGTGDLYTGGITLGKKINDNWRFGIFSNSSITNPTIGAVSMNSDPAVGGFVTWSRDRLSIQASVAANRGALTVDRNGPELGTGKSNTETQAYQLRVNYSIPVTQTVTATPYVGVRRTESTYSGYTETGPEFPLTVNATSRKVTDALAGVSLSKQFTEKLTASVSVGVVQRLNEQMPTYTGTSEIGGLSTFSSSIPNNGKTNASVGVGVSYAVDKNTRIGVNAGIQQKGENANISSIGISITRGF